MAFNRFRPGTQTAAPEAAAPAADQAKPVTANRFGFRPPKPAAELTPDDIPEHLRIGAVEKPTTKMGFRRR